jgi:TRAP-type uncharacterized transport system fused permease subunit
MAVMSDEKKTRAPGTESQGTRRRFTEGAALCVTILAVSLSLYQLYTAGISPLAAMYQRSVHLVLIMALAFALIPPARRASRTRFDFFLAFDLLLIVLTFAVGGYIWKEFDSIIQRQGLWNRTDVVMGCIALALVLESTRRAIGIFMALIGVAFLLFSYFGPYMPGFLAHKGYSVERIVTTL